MSVTPLRRESALVVITLFWAVAPLSAQVITRWPYVQLGAPDSILIAWHTDTPTESTVEYDLDLSYGLQASNPGPVTDHAVVLAGLQAGTTYFYRITSGGQVLGDGAELAEDLSFATNPDPAVTPPAYRFVVFGDSGDGSADQQAVATQIGASSPDFGIITGDVVYETGAAADFDPHYFDIYHDTISGAVFYPDAGNDEHEARLRTTSPPNWVAVTPTGGGDPATAPVTFR